MKVELPLAVCLCWIDLFMGLVFMGGGCWGLVGGLGFNRGGRGGRVGRIGF